MNEELNLKLSNLPENPGVYIYKNNQNKIIYIGKAKNLKNRVRSYFNNTDDNRQFFTHLVQQIANVDWLITNTEQEALILENSLIKQFKPKYNIDLKDDSNFYSVRIKSDSPFIRLELVRNPKDDGSKYFGPYTSASSLKKTIQFLNNTFKLRTCSDSELSSRMRPCILYQINRCSAPCVGKISEKNYAENVKKVEQILKGNAKIIISELEAEMQRHSDALAYEKAGDIRDQIKAIQKTLETQHIIDNDFVDRDVFAYFSRNDKLYVQGLFIRDGVIRSYYYQEFVLFGRLVEELFTSFLKIFYSKTVFLPKEILIPFLNEEINLLEELLQKSTKVIFICPQKGSKKNLLDLCFKNAQENANTKEAENIETEMALSQIQKAFSLHKLPVKMECYDISNIQGNDSVASGVAFENGKPYKKRYKKYKVKTVDQANDFASLNEIIYRRIKRGLQENNLPDLIVIDGGKGQLNAALSALREFETDVEIISIAKARSEKGTVDRFFIPGAENPIFLEENSKAIKILMNIRDEAHRFAITFHRKLRGKKFKDDPLYAIPGIGPLKRKDLLSTFGNIGAIRNASKEELMKVNGINEELANAILEHLAFDS